MATAKQVKEITQKIVNRFETVDYRYYGDAFPTDLAEALVSVFSKYASPIIKEILKEELKGVNPGCQKSLISANARIKFLEDKLSSYEEIDKIVRMVKK